VNVAGHGTKSAPGDERVVLGDGARPLYFGGAIAAIVGLVVAMVLGIGHDNFWQPFLFAYLAAYCFFLSIVLGALFFVLMQHLTAAGWSVTVRRLAESITSLMPTMALLAIPLIVSAVLQSGTLYAWAVRKDLYPPEMQTAVINGDMETAHRIYEKGLGQTEKTENDANAPLIAHSPPPHDALDPLTLQKRITGIHWLNPWFFAIRIIIYVLLWMWMARYYRRLSKRQDTTGDPALSRRMQSWSGFHMVLLGLTLTGAAGDLFMSLDPHWYSTMWGVYYFAGCTVSNFSVLIITVFLLQRAGYLRNSINREHYQDLGKYLFGFTFFWGYIAFSQYMLLWYSNIPDEVGWLSRHGATTAPTNVTGWSFVVLAILFGQLLIPFGGLMSRHVKRKFGVLVCWAVWQLSFHLIDTYWIVMPEYPGKMSVSMVLLSVAMTIAMGGLLMAVLVRNMLGQNLRPVADPRLVESLAFHNI
jgi:hypothetical protein